MDNETLDNKLKKITYKLGLLSYFIKICKMDMKDSLNADEFSGFLCSGIVPIMLSWIEKELLAGKEAETFTLDDLVEAKKMIQEHAEYFS